MGTTAKRIADGSAHTAKRAFLLVALLVAVLGATAQKDRVFLEIRDDIVEVEGDGEEYTVFTYTQKDSTFGYWLGLGSVDNLPGRLFGPDDFTETCIYLGATATEALARLDTIVACFDMGDEEVHDFAAMMAVGRPLRYNGFAACFVQRVLFGKRLCFRFVYDEHITDSYLTRSAAKSLRGSFKFNARKELKRKQQ